MMNEKELRKMCLELLDTDTIQGELMIQTIQFYDSTQIAQRVGVEVVLSKLN